MRPKPLTALLLLVLLPACVRNPGDTQNLHQRGIDQPLVRSKAESDAKRMASKQTVNVRTIHNTGYVALSDVAAAVGYHGTWLRGGRTYGIGDTDPVWIFRPGESAAVKAGKPVRLPAPAVMEQGRLFIPMSAVSGLFNREADFLADASGLTVLPRPIAHEMGTDGASLPFSDASPDGRERSFAASESSAKAEDAIAFAKQFLGVKYEFGAAPYEQSGAFDCSSFVRYVMRHEGVELPRSSRQQAAVGMPVSRAGLLPGDLLFFNVPGRFKNPGAVGHVGIYIGGGQMIHASPGTPDGVKITNLNGSYLRRTFLFAKRVLV